MVVGITLLLKISIIPLGEATCSFLSFYILIALMKFCLLKLINKWFATSFLRLKCETSHFGCRGLRQSVHSAHFP